MTEITDRYFNDLIARLAGLRDRLAGPMAKAADLIAAAARADRRVFVFGTGHSHMMAEELHYRAGGLAITVPVLCGSIMLQDGAVAARCFDRFRVTKRPQQPDPIPKAKKTVRPICREIWKLDRSGGRERGRNRMTGRRCDLPDPSRGCVIVRGTTQRWRDGQLVVVIPLECRSQSVNLGIEALVDLAHDETLQDDRDKETGQQKRCNNGDDRGQTQPRGERGCGRVHCKPAVSR